MTRNPELKLCIDCGHHIRRGSVDLCRRLPPDVDLVTGARRDGRMLSCDAERKPLQPGVGMLRCLPYGEYWKPREPLRRDPEWLVDFLFPPVESGEYDDGSGALMAAGAIAVAADLAGAGKGGET